MPEAFQQVLQFIGGKINKTKNKVNTQKSLLFNHIRHPSRSIAGEVKLEWDHKLGHYIISQLKRKEHIVQQDERT